MEAAVQALRSTLPVEWSVTRAPQPLLGGDGPDALLTITAPDGFDAVLLIESRRTVVPRDVARVAEQVNAYASVAEREGRPIAGTLVVAPFVSPTTRSRLDDSGLGWFDLTGNLRLRLDRPAVFLDRAGADRGESVDSADRSLKSLRGSAAARVVLALCEVPLPSGVRQLAEQAQVSVATSARVLELLDRETAVERSGSGVVTAVRKRTLVERWSRDYGVMTSNEVLTTLDPRGLTHALNGLVAADARVTVTGSAAVRAYLPDGVTPISPLVSLSLYADDPIALMSQMDLKPVDRGANVLVMRPYDDVVHARARPVGGVRFAAPAQVVADLLTGPGRSGEEAEQLITALGTSDRGWER